LYRDQFFNIINESNDDVYFQLKFSILQIYKEVIYDLLTGEKDLKVKENPTRGIYAENLSEVFIDNIDTFYQLLKLSQEQRIVGETKLNQFSSRSHAIFMLEVTQNFQNETFQKKGLLNLIDLAGSEKVSKTGAVGETLEEAKKINLSLSALGNVIHCLTSNSDYIPYRDSKLTRLLQESLGGNFKTSLIVTCSQHSSNFEETMSSLKFAQRAKTIKNTVKINIKQSYEELQQQVILLKSVLAQSNNKVIYYQKILEKNNIDNVDKIDKADKEDKEDKVGKADKNTTEDINTFKLDGDDSSIKYHKNPSATVDILDKSNNQMKTVEDINNNFTNLEVDISAINKHPSSSEIDAKFNNMCKDYNDQIKNLNSQITQLKKELKQKEDVIKDLTRNQNDLRESKEIFKKGYDEVKESRSSEISDKLEPILLNIEAYIKSSCDKFSKIFDNTLRTLFIKNNNNTNTCNITCNNDTNQETFNSFLNKNDVNILFFNNFSLI